MSKICGYSEASQLKYLSPKTKHANCIWIIVHTLGSLDRTVWAFCAVPSAKMVDWKPIVGSLVPRCKYSILQKLLHNAPKNVSLTTKRIITFLYFDMIFCTWVKSYKRQKKCENGQIFKEYILNSFKKLINLHRKLPNNFKYISYIIICLVASAGQNTIQPLKEYI